MSGPHQISPIENGRAGGFGPVRQSHFTLVELLVVLVITGIMFGLVIAPFDAMLGSTGVDGGARMVASQLRLARQYAISQRKRIAVLFPADEGPDALRYTAFRSCEVVWDSSSSEWRFHDWIPNTKWEYLPPGTIVKEVDEDLGETAFASVSEPVVVHNVDGVAADDFRAVVFKPNGAITHAGSLYVYVVEGYFVPTSPPASPFRIAREDNFQQLEIGQYTGRVTFQ